MEESYLEVADALADAERNKGIERSRAALQRQTHPDFDGLNCVDCPEEIPAARLEAGRVRCTACESAQERRAKLTGMRD